MIINAKKSEIADILLLTRACTDHMIKQGIYQWTSEYPSKRVFEKDVERKELYILKKGTIVQGCIVISTIMDNEYKNVQWLTPKNNIYLHRLAVHPKYQGKGCAQKLIKFAENYALKNNFTSVRLDTFSQNKRNIRFYEKRGYKKLEDIFFPKQSEFPFHCYELVLNS